jgi:hypothetical protein
MDVKKCLHKILRILKSTSVLNESPLNKNKYESSSKYHV